MIARGGGKTGIQRIIKKQEEIFGFGTCVHYLDCGDGFIMVVFMYQNISSCTF